MAHCEAHNVIDQNENSQNFDPVTLTYTPSVMSTRLRNVLKDITPKPLQARKSNFLQKNIHNRKKVGGLR